MPCIRIRNLLVYSNCNKSYRKSIIDKLGLRFGEGIDFGEDRLFNYAFIQGCGRIRTSSLNMLAYIQRNTDSLSSRRVERYFERVLSLREAKMECFLGLSREETDEEKDDFSARDLAYEVVVAIDRFAAHPKERADTADSLGFYVENAGVLPGESLLAVTSNRYCNRQFLQLAHYMVQRR